MILILSILSQGDAIAQSRPTPPRSTYYARPPVRRVYTTVPSRSVHISVGASPWVSTWQPAPRPGWVWVSGRYDPYGMWSPGYWRVSRAAPSGYVYVDGFWQGSVYVDGWYRTPQRDGWIWMETRYRADGSVVPGHWRPQQTVPDGYVWEPGLFDGKGYTDGFWRPAQRGDFRWVPAQWRSDGSWVAGYWMPLTVVDDKVWEPGWFDGTTWVEGRWVRDAPPRKPSVPASDGALAIPVEAN